MAEYDLTLDEIIKRKRQTRGNQIRAAPGRIRQIQGQNKGRSIPGRSTGIPGLVKPKQPVKQMEDARLKLIRKQRSQGKDARLHLNKLTKGIDARQTLNQIRLVANKKKAFMSKGVTSVPRKIQVARMGMKKIGAGSGAVRKVQNQVIKGRQQVTSQQIQASRGPVPRRPAQRVAVINGTRVQKPVRQMSAAVVSAYKHGGYNNLPSRAVTRNIRRIEVPQRYAPYKDVGKELIIEDELDSSIEYEYVPRQDLSGSMKSRLDTPSRTGYRVIISNLNVNVTVEDIDELFRNIGPLYSSSLIAPGVGEVMFVHLNDAHRSVQHYNNRQLDGLPMKVQVSHHTGTNYYNAPEYHPRQPQPHSVLRNARGRSGYYM